MDITGRNPALHAVDSHNMLCLNLIIEAGGNPDPTMPHGMFCRSPLTAAGFAGISGLLKLLLDFEANPSACIPEEMTAWNLITVLSFLCIFLRLISLPYKVAYYYVRH